MKKAYDQGTLLMLGDVVARIGCAAAMPKDHKNEWMQNRFSLKPAGLIQVPGHKGSHLVWREADVEKARRMWEEAHHQETGDRKQETGKPTGTNRKPVEVRFWGENAADIAAELKAIDAETPGWKKTPDAGTDLARSMIDLAAKLLHQAQEMLKAGAA